MGPLSCTERERPLLLCGDLLECEGELKLAQRSTRAQQAHVLRLLPTESARAGRSLAHMQAGRVRGQHRRVSPIPCTHKKTGFSLVQCPSIGPGPTTTSAARRARAESVLAAPPPEIERAQWRDRVCAHTQAGCLMEAAAGTWERGSSALYRRREASRWRSGLSKGMGRLQPARRGALPRRKRAWCTSSRERASAVARLRLRTRASRLCWRPRLAHRSTAFHRTRQFSFLVR